MLSLQAFFSSEKDGKSFGVKFSLEERTKTEGTAAKNKKTEAIGAGALLQLVLSLLFDRHIDADKVVDSGSSVYPYPSDCLLRCSNERTDPSQVRRMW